MEDTSRMKLVIAGLFLAAVAAGYLIFSQFRNEPIQFQGNTNRTVQQMQTATPSATPVGSSIPGSTSGPDGGTTKGGLPQTGVSSLPATGNPAFLVAIFGVSGAVAGFFLRKFPK